MGAELTFTGLDGREHPLVSPGGKITFRRSEVTEEYVNVSIPRSGAVRYIGAGTCDDRTYSINGVEVSRRTWVAAYPPSWGAGKGIGDPLAGNM